MKEFSLGGAAKFWRDRVRIEAPGNSKIWAEAFLKGLASVQFFADGIVSCHLVTAELRCSGVQRGHRRPFLSPSARQARGVERLTLQQLHRAAKPATCSGMAGAVGSVLRAVGAQGY